MLHGQAGRGARAGRRTQAPHLDVSVFARGLLDRVVTRLYFPDEPAANAADPVLASVDDRTGAHADRRAPTDDGYRFDIRLQGDDETVFFADLSRAGLLRRRPGPRRRRRGAVGRRRPGCRRMLDVEAALARAAARRRRRAARRRPRRSPRACARRRVDPADARPRRPPPAATRWCRWCGALRAALARTTPPLRPPRSDQPGHPGHRGDAGGRAGARRRCWPTSTPPPTPPPAWPPPTATPPMAGRTLLQQAVPTTFGLKAAGWLAGLDEAAARLAEVGAEPPGRPARRRGRHAGRARRRRARRSPRGSRRELGLAEPVLPWHTDRTRSAELAGALGAAAGAVGKVGPRRDAAAQNEVGEVAEGAPRRVVGDGAQAQPGRGGQRARPRAAQAPGLVATLLAAMVQEHERAAGAWHAEWRPLRELLVAAGLGRVWLRDLPGRAAGAPATRCGRTCDRLLTVAGGALDLGQRARPGGRRACRPGDRPEAPHERRDRCTTLWTVRPDAPVLLLGSVAGHRRPRCGRRRCRRWPRGSGWSGTTTAGTAAPRCRPARTRWPTWAATCWRCSTGSDVARAHVGGLSLGGMVAMWLGGARARAGRPAGARLHVGQARPADLWAERAAVARGQGLAAHRRRGGRPLAHARVRQRAPRRRRASCGRCFLATPADGYAGVLRRHPDDGPRARPGPDRRRRRWSWPGLDDEATPPEHAKRIARPRSPAAGWRWWPGRRTWPTCPTRTWSPNW